MRISMRKIPWLVGALAGMALAGCARDVSPQEAPTVSWYMAHKDERVAKGRWCADDTARQRTAICQNAAEAEQRVMMGPNAKSSADDLKFK
jgi:uncharacterized lipoprotein YbaY